MTQDGMAKIKSKLQELSALIKEEAVSESREIREDILKSVDEMKSTLEDQVQSAESKSREIIDEKKEDLQDLLGELETKALKVQYTIQEKYSQGISQKDELVKKASESLIEVINRAKNTLQSDRNPDKE